MEKRGDTVGGIKILKSIIITLIICSCNEKSDKNLLNDKSNIIDKHERHGLSY